jgi:hypothetical protein
LVADGQGGALPGGERALAAADVEGVAGAIGQDRDEVGVAEQGGGGGGAEPGAVGQGRA